MGNFRMRNPEPSISPTIAIETLTSIDKECPRRVNGMVSLDFPRDELSRKDGWCPVACNYGETQWNVRSYVRRACYEVRPDMRELISRTQTGGMSSRRIRMDADRSSICQDTYIISEICLVIAASKLSLINLKLNRDKTCGNEKCVSRARSSQYTVPE